MPGTYQLVSSSAQLGPAKAFMTVTNPPNQASGSIWYSVAGTANVFYIPSGVISKFTNIPCLNTPGSLDSVIVSGQVECL